MTKFDVSVEAVEARKAARKKRQNRVAGVILVAMVAWMGYQVMGPSKSNRAVAPIVPRATPRPKAQPTSAFAAVRYVIPNTSGEFDVTMTNEQGGTEQHTVKGPWSYTFMARHGAFVYVSSQADKYSGCTVQIWLNGKVVRESECDGQYCIASASGLVP